MKHPQQSCQGTLHGMEHAARSWYGVHLMWLEPIGAALPRKEGTGSNDPYLGRRVRWYRDAQKWSLTKLAEETGLTKGFLSKLENGLAGASYTTAEILANALGVPVSSIWNVRIPPDDAEPPKLRKRL